MRSATSSVVKVFCPDSEFELAVLEAVKKLKDKFPERDLSSLAGISAENGERVLWFARGFMRFRNALGVSCGCMVKGPLVEVDYNPDLLDERSKYQEPLVAKAVQSEEGIIVSPTGSGKTVVETMIVCNLKRRALILTHTIEIARQIAATFKRLTGVEPGVIYEGKRDVRPITIGLIQSVKSEDPILKEIGLLLIDEAHHLSAPTFLAVLKECPAKYRIGLTATIRKTGEAERIVFAAIGPVIAEIGVKDLQATGHLNRGVYRVIETGTVGTYSHYVAEKCWWYKAAQKTGEPAKCPAPCTYPMDGNTERCAMAKGYFGWVYCKMMEDPMRNERILQETFQASKDHPWIVVITHRKKHAKFLAEKLTEKLNPIWIAVGPPEMKRAESKGALQGFRDHGGVLVATSGLIGEGFDAPKTSCLVRAMPSGGMVSVRQQTGRIMRPQDRPALIVDFVDFKIPRMARMWRGRKSIYHAIGFTEEPRTKEEGDLF